MAQRSGAATKRSQPQMDTDGHGFYRGKQGKRRGRRMGARKMRPGMARKRQRTGERPVKFHRSLRAISTIAVQSSGATKGMATKDHKDHREQRRNGPLSLALSLALSPRRGEGKSAGLARAVHSSCPT